MVCDQRVRMSMADAMLDLEIRDLLHMFLVVQAFENLDPVRDRLAVGFLDGGK
jgi:hypothetical protein